MFRNSALLHLTTVLATTLALAFGCASVADETEPTAEKRVMFYTTYGFEQNNEWIIPLRIWVNERPDYARLAAAQAVGDELMQRAGLDRLDDEQQRRFMYRADGFIADSESNQIVAFKFDDDPDNSSFQIRNAAGQTNTDRNGLIEGNLTLTAEKASALMAAQKSTDGWLTFRAVNDNHEGIGRVRLIAASGISVISDIDDTIKVTDIPSGESEVIMNTFFRAFRAAPCMPEIYQSFGAEVAFHYVSGGPWQLYAPLASFLQSESGGFPEGSFHMKNVRTNLFELETYQDIWRLLAGGSKQATYEQKLGQISALLHRFPDRNFILIGDSGERDPEVFGAIREQFPKQVAEIRIRDLVNDQEHNPERLRGMTIIPPAFDANLACTDVAQAQ